MSAPLLIRQAARFGEPDGALGVDLRCRDGRIVEVGARLASSSDERVIDARGASVVPGLHDHHIHLFALAAAERSVRCGPPDVMDRDGLRRALVACPGNDWIRGVGYDDTVCGEIDAAVLDVWLPDRPVRIQHRSGVAWVLNTAAMRALVLDDAPDLAGIERDAGGRLTGRLFRLDGWLRTRLVDAEPVRLRDTSRRLARYGIAGVTDASATNDTHTAAHFRALAASGDLLQRVRTMGGPGVGLDGEVKILLDEGALPPLDEIVGAIRAAHAADRDVAFHCVTRAELVLALAALDEAGVRGDRIEHAAVVTDAMMPLLARLRPTVVTQPGFVHAHGDRYRRDVPANEHDQLYRCASLLRAGVPVAFGSDAPYGPTNPWLIMHAAVERSTCAGALLGAAERIAPEAALRAFCSRADDPGGRLRTLRPGDPADLCVLADPWHAVRERLPTCVVRATVRNGEVIYETDENDEVGRTVHADSEDRRAPEERGLRR
jgi:predicted amidohydrolase YtcJ